MYAPRSEAPCTLTHLLGPQTITTPYLHTPTQLATLKRLPHLQKNFMLTKDDLELLTALEKSNAKSASDVSNLERISNIALSTINAYNSVDRNSFDDEAQKNYIICAAAFKICRKLKVGNSNKITIRLIKWTTDIPPRFETLGISNELSTAALQLIISTRPSWAATYLLQILNDSNCSEIWKVVLSGLFDIWRVQNIQTLKEAIAKKMVASEEFSIWLVDYQKLLNKSATTEAAQLLLELLAPRLQDFENGTRQAATKTYCLALSSFLEKSPASILDPIFIGRICPAVSQMAEVRPALLAQMLSAAASILQKANDILSSDITPQELFAIYDPLISAKKVSSDAKKQFDSTLDQLQRRKTGIAPSGIDPLVAVGDLLWDLFDEYDQREDERVTVSVKNLMRQLQLGRIGEKDEQAEYNPTIHSFIGKPHAGRIKIVKPGLTAAKNGHKITLRKAFVTSV